MSVCVLVLADNGAGISGTVESLRAQSLPAHDVAVILSARQPGPVVAATLDEIVSGDPDLTLAELGHAGIGGAAAAVVRGAGAEWTTVLVSGTRLLPDALKRLTELGSRAGADAVIGRASGAIPWGFLDDRALLSSRPATPVPLLIARSGTALPALKLLDDELPVPAWHEAWQQGVLHQARHLAACVTRPCVRGHRLRAPESLDVLRSAVTWMDTSLRLEATFASAPASGQPSLARTRMLLGNAATGVECPLETRTEGHEGWRDVSASLDLVETALGDGSWRPGVDLVDEGYHGRGHFRNRPPNDAVVGGRPVVWTRKGDHLELQIGRVRRNFLRGDPAAARFDVSGGTVRMSLPLDELLMPDGQPLSGHIVVDGTRLPAVVRRVGDRPELHVELPVHGPSGAVLADFGNIRPARTGLRLRRAHHDSYALIRSGRATG